MMALEHIVKRHYLMSRWRVPGLHCKDGTRRGIPNVLSGVRSKSRYAEALALDRIHASALEDAKARRSHIILR